LATSRGARVVGRIHRREDSFDESWVQSLRGRLGRIGGTRRERVAVAWTPPRTIGRRRPSFHWGRGRRRCG
jgi:hypothetical protein